MHVEISDEQLTTLVELVDARIKAIHPEIRRSRVYTVHDKLKDELEKLDDLLEDLRQAQTVREAEAWEGYVETRTVPSNPPPEN